MFAVTSAQSVGGTFLDWSIQFLSGQTQTYHVKSRSWHDLPANPVGSINAHLYKKNHPAGLIETQQCIVELKNKPNLQSVFFARLPLDQVAVKLGLSLDNLAEDTTKQLFDHVQADHQATFKHCTEQFPVVVVELDPAYSLYYCKVRALDRYLLSPDQPGSAEDLTAEKDRMFFNSSIEAYNQLGLTDVWDIRERRALCIRPLSSPQIELDFKLPHYWLEARSLFNNGEDTLSDIMSWMQLPVVTERWSQWEPVYQQWRQLQQQALDFQYRCKHIVESIVNGWDYNVGELTFEQEVVVLHFLIYQYGLNLKSWKLVKFPTQARELHKLLEPNIHPVENF